MTKTVVLSQAKNDELNYYISKIVKGKLGPEVFVMPTEDFKEDRFSGQEFFVIYDSSDKLFQKTGKDMICKKTDFGLQEGANFWASDINFSEGIINFKLNYRGNSVPIWFKPFFVNSPEKEVCNVLPAICLGDFLGMNIVEISENLNN